MIATPHSALGFGIGLITLSHVHNPAEAVLIGFTVSFVSHYVADSFPHGHFNGGKKNAYNSFLVPVDFFGGLILFSYLSYLKFNLSINALIVIICILANLMPDIINYLAFVNKKLLKNWFFKLNYQIHNITHWHGAYANARKLYWIDIWQLILTLGCISLFWKSF